MGGGAPERWVEWAGTRRPVEAGDVITFGRGRSRDILLPDDVQISRFAGSINVDEDHVEIVNVSEARPFVLRPPVGEAVVVHPGSSATNRGMPALSVVLVGTRGVEYMIGLRAPGLLPGGPREEGRPTQGRPFSLNAMESAVLAALCKPMLLGSGSAAAPASYADIATELGRSSGYVRNVVRGVRDRLTDAGVPGFDGTARDAPSDFRRSLAYYAIRVGWGYGPEDDG